MATSCVSTNHCGTHAPGWLNGAHPTVADSQVTRQACFHYFSTCCVWSINIQVRNCGDYFVYYINRTPLEHTCHLRYCGADLKGRWRQLFLRILTAHGCTRKFTCHVIHRARAPSTKMNKDRADGHLS